MRSFCQLYTNMASSSLLSCLNANAVLTTDLLSILGFRYFQEVQTQTTAACALRIYICNNNIK